MISKYFFLAFLCTTIAFYLIYLVAMQLSLLPVRSGWSRLIESLVVGFVCAGIVSYFINKRRKRNKVE